MPVIIPHRYQEEIILDDARFKVCTWGRRSGKTTGAKYKICHKAFNEPGAKIWYVALTYGQAKTLMWDPLVGDGNGERLIAEELIAHKSVSDLSITLINGSKIWLKGANVIDNVLGENLDLLILDEFQSMSMNIWNKLRPMLSDRKGEALINGTPRGYNHFHDLFWRGSSDNPNRLKDWKSWRITSIDAAEAGTGLDPQEILDAQNDMSSDQYRQEFLAEFDAVSGRVFKPFSLTDNVTDKPFTQFASEWDQLPLHVGMDFNVSPMTAVLAIKPDSRSLYVFDELYLENSNTPQMCEELKRKASTRSNKAVLVYPDASGSARTSTGNSTNHAIIQAAGFRLVSDKKNPPIVDRINEVNALLENAQGVRRLFIHPRCKNLIKSLHSLTYTDNGDPDKSSGFDHMADAIGYMVHQLFPIKTSGGLVIGKM